MNHRHDAHTPLASHTKARHPQYNSDNMSAAERGQAAAEQQHLVLRPAGPEIATQAPNAEDPIDAGWEDIGSEPSAPTAPSTSASNAGPARASASTSTSGAANAGAALTSTSLLALELTASNMRLHDVMHNRGSINERLWNRQRGHSTIVTFPYTSSNISIELGEPFGPFCVDSPASSMFGIGAWADTARPPML